MHQFLYNAESSPGLNDSTTSSKSTHLWKHWLLLVDGTLEQRRWQPCCRQQQTERNSWTLQSLSWERETLMVLILTMSTQAAEEVPQKTNRASPFLCRLVFYQMQNIKNGWGIYFILDCFTSYINQQYKQFMTHFYQKPREQIP